MRLDLFLKKTCIVRQRGEAKSICDAGAVLVNERAAKAAHEVHAGDHIELRLARRRTVLRVVAIPHGNVARAEAARYVEILADVPVDPSF